MARNKVYDGMWIGGGDPESFMPGRFHPVHLADILSHRDKVFRKLGVGSQANTWPVRDRSAFKRRAELNRPKGWVGKALEGDSWPTQFANLPEMRIRQKKKKAGNRRETGTKTQKNLKTTKPTVPQPGDKRVDPLTDNWSKANFLNSRCSIQLLQRRDGWFSLILDFPAPLMNAKNTSYEFKPPGLLTKVPTTYKADIFPLGLLFWEIVMLRRLVETRCDSDDTGNRLLRDLDHRLDPAPASIRVQWRDTYQLVAKDGNALDMQERGGKVYEPDDFEYGDIWHQAGIRKPLDMDDTEMKTFVEIVKKMLRWGPEARPTTAELLEHEWFKDLVVQIDQVKSTNITG
ncbi:hypothetical protein BGZ60DRAFT_428921 [Tricladium varicosporioides]|nr:hypothetical protein BGZ60DRAFT_428921 [Hymenoscyphus varicosporioides]